jgi:hypothetical protein
MRNRGVVPGPLTPHQLASLYLTAKERVIAAGFADEIDWQESVSLDDLNESTFLRESAWVVLSSGFRESVLRRRFPDISSAFLQWASAELIISHRESCQKNALVAFGNRRKISAILKIVEQVASAGIEVVRQQILDRGTEFLREFPFIGPITSCHLAKNLGLPIVKPDRHLTRIAAHTGYESPDRMCRIISEYVGDALGVIDVVLWRYATLRNLQGLGKSQGGAGGCSGLT